MKDKMIIEIWSDVLCPFCYIGKRNLEKALEQFPHKNAIEVIWKSYQLDPNFPEKITENYNGYLVKRKGMTESQVEGMLDNVTQTAKQAGLNFNLDKSIIVNSRNAHKLIQLAKTQEKGDLAEEHLFRAFFTDGKNISDHDVLTHIGVEIGLHAGKVANAFTDETYEALMKQDLLEAQELGVQGVPFFVLNRKYAISGAQPVDTFLDTLEKSFSEWREENPNALLDISQGQSCTPEGNCD